LQRAFPPDVPMVNSPKLSFVSNSNNLTGIDLAPGETIPFGSMEFITDHLGRLSLSPYEGDSSTIFVGMVHSGSPSLDTGLEDSSDEGSTTSCAGGALDPPAPRLQRGNFTGPHPTASLSGAAISVDPCLAD
jgi:hypothetical protein